MKKVLYRDLVPGDRFQFCRPDCQLGRHYYTVIEERNPWGAYYCINNNLGHHFALSKDNEILKLEPASTTLGQLPTGAKFRPAYSSFDQDLCIKTDEKQNGEFRCVDIEGPRAGIITYGHPDLMVIPEPGHEPKADPWGEAETTYGELGPGELFRRGRGEGSDEVCCKTSRRGDDGDFMYIDDNGNLCRGFLEGAKIYWESALREHGV